MATTTKIIILRKYTTPLQFYDKLMFILSVFCKYYFIQERKSFSDKLDDSTWNIFQGTTFIFREKQTAELATDTQKRKACIFCPKTVKYRTLVLIKKAKQKAMHNLSYDVRKNWKNVSVIINFFHCTQSTFAKGNIAPTSLYYIFQHEGEDI